MNPLLKFISSIALALLLILIVGVGKYGQEVFAAAVILALACAGANLLPSKY